MCDCAHLCAGLLCPFANTCMQCKWRVWQVVPSQQLAHIAMAVYAVCVGSVLLLTGRDLWGLLCQPTLGVQHCQCLQTALLTAAACCRLSHGCHSRRWGKAVTANSALHGWTATCPLSFTSAKTVTQKLTSPGCEHTDDHDATPADCARARAVTWHCMQAFFLRSSESK